MSSRNQEYEYVYLHPPEADYIASHIKTLRDRLKMEYANLETEYQRVTNDWEGHQKDVFCGKASKQTVNLAEYIDYLQKRHDWYRDLMVGTWVPVSSRH
jgi:uncharacterized protein YukE